MITLKSVYFLFNFQNTSITHTIKLYQYIINRRISLISFFLIDWV